MSHQPTPPNAAPHRSRSRRWTSVFAAGALTLLCGLGTVPAQGQSGAAESQSAGTTAESTGEPARISAEVSSAVADRSSEGDDAADGLGADLGAETGTETEKSDSANEDPAAEDSDTSWIDDDADRVELLVYFGDEGVEASAKGSPELAADALQDDADEQWSRIDAGLSALEADDRVSVLNRFWVTNAVLVSAEASDSTLERLAALPGATEITPNSRIEALDEEDPTPVETDAESDADAGEPETTYGVQKIRADTAWDDFGTRGQGVRVAVLDTGVDATHPDIAPRLVGRDSGDPSYPGGWMNFDRNGKPLLSKPTDPGSHGTHVAGTILGGSASGTQIGVAPDAELMAANVLSGGGSSAKILAALQWVIEPYDSDGNAVGRPADVINMSLGVDEETFDVELAQAMQNVRDAGIFPVVAIGNEGDGVTSSPGDFYNAFSVGMTDEQDQVDSRSSGGQKAWGEAITEKFGWPESYTKPEVSAPGVDVYSSLPGGKYGLSSGTSMASPHVAGAVALMRSAQADLGVDDIAQALEETAVHPTGSEQDTRYGYGRIDVHAAIAAVRGESMVTGTVVDAATGKPVGGATVSYADRGETWTTTAEGEFTARLPEGKYTLTVERFGYETATATAEVPKTGSAEISIELTPITTGSISGTVVDKESGDPISGATVQLLGQPITTTTDAKGGYRLTDLPVGDYRLRVSAEGRSAEVSPDATVRAALETTVNFTMTELSRVLVLGDNGGRTAALLADNGFTAESSTTLPADLTALSGYDSVVWDAPEGDITKDRIAQAIKVTDDSGTGIVWLDLGDSDQHGIGVRSALTGDPAERSSADDRTASAVGYRITADHPIFAGGMLSPDKIDVNEIVAQNTAASGPKPASWFGALTGTNPTVLAETVVQHTTDPDDPDSVQTEALGTGIAVDQRAKNRHVLLALHGSYTAVDARNWSAAGSQLLLNSVQWSVTEQQNEPEVIVPTPPEVPNGDGGRQPVVSGNGGASPTTPATTATTTPTQTTQSSSRAPSTQKLAKPKTKPEAPVESSADLTSENAGGIKVRIEDDIAYVTIPDSKPGDWFFLHVYPSKTAVDWIRVNDDGELRIDISRLRAGSYRFAFTDSTEKFVGWVEVKVPGEVRNAANAQAPTSDDPTVIDGTANGTSPETATGFTLSSTEQLILLGSALLVLAAAALVLFGPRKKPQPVGP